MGTFFHFLREGFARKIISIMRMAFRDGTNEKIHDTQREKHSKSIHKCYHRPKSLTLALHVYYVAEVMTNQYICLLPCTRERLAERNTNRISVTVHLRTNMHKHNSMELFSRFWPAHGQPQQQDFAGK